LGRRYNVILSIKKKSPALLGPVTQNMAEISCGVKKREKTDGRSKEAEGGARVPGVQGSLRL